ncbi:MAG: hypothetical protein J0I20_25535 [Chloroflexi bacterium]|nr:hypothetical protein [Chloroflexota bacterium]OJW01861.1 MAG: hypothetical protein BGO39_28325 [Chloroflexi bacterium 54-19]
MTEVNLNSRPVTSPVPGEAAYSDWARQFVEGLVETERRCLELVATQNELVINAIQQGLEAFRSAPTAGLGEWARQGMENFLEVQRSLSGSFDQQRAQFLNSQFQPGSEMAAGLNMPAGQMAGLMTQPLELLADARRRWLDYAASQNAQVVEGVKRALGVREGTPAATYIDWTQDAVNTYADFQKRWLDLLTQFSFPAPGQATRRMPGN